MAAEIGDLVQEIAELRLLIAAWSRYEDPQLAVVTHKMQERLEHQLARLAELMELEEARRVTIH